MENFTNSEYVDMLIVYGAAGENAAHARRLYLQRFPDRRIPSERTFLIVVQRGRETGSLTPRRGIGGGRPHRQDGVNVEENILQIVEDDPTVSSREISRQLEVSQSLVWCTLNTNKLYPYHMERVQGLPAGVTLSTQTFQHLC